MRDGNTKIGAVFFSNGTRGVGRKMSTVTAVTNSSSLWNNNNDEDTVLMQLKIAKNRIGVWNFVC